MPGHHFRNITDPDTQFAGTLAEINVLKPDRMEDGIESTQPLPQVAPECEHGAGRLIHVGWPTKIQTETTVAPIHGIPGCRSIQPKHFKSQRPRRWESPHRESLLRVSASVQ